MSWYIEVLKKYAVFSGRARRKEYWFFTLVNSIILIVLMSIAMATMPQQNYYGGSVSFGPMYYVYLLYALATFLPNLAVTVRRLHDTDRSGWWFLIAFVPLVGGIILLVFLVTAGTDGDNQYGSDPLDEASDNSSGRM